MVTIRRKGERDPLYPSDLSGREATWVKPHRLSLGEARGCGGLPVSPQCPDPRHVWPHSGCVPWGGRPQAVGKRVLPGAGWCGAPAGDAQAEPPRDDPPTPAQHTRGAARTQAGPQPRGHPRGGCTGTHASPGTVTAAHAHASHPHVLTRTGRTEPHRPVLPHPPAAGPIRSPAARAASVGGVTRSSRPSSAR